MNPGGMHSAHFLVRSYGGALQYKRILPPTGSSEPATTHHSLVAGMPTLRILVTNTKVTKETGEREARPHRGGSCCYP